MLSKDRNDTRKMLLPFGPNNQIRIGFKTQEGYTMLSGGGVMASIVDLASLFT